MERLESAAVLGRARALAGHAEGIVDPLRRRRGFLHADIDPPALAEVVVVGHPVAVGQVQVRKGDIAVVLDDQVVALDGIAEPELVQDEGVRLVVKPVEGDLDRVMQAGQPHPLADEEPPPHLGLRADHDHAQAEDPLGGFPAPGPPALL